RTRGYHVGRGQNQRAGLREQLAPADRDLRFRLRHGTLLAGGVPRLSPSARSAGRGAVLIESLPPPCATIVAMRWRSVTGAWLAWCVGCAVSAALAAEPVRRIEVYVHPYYDSA